MKKYFMLLWVCVCAVVFAAAHASAEEFFASDFTGAVMQDKIVTQNEDEAEVVYEWYASNGGMYNVSFNDAVCNDCTVAAYINGGPAIKIGDITKVLEMGFKPGNNQIKLNVTKNSSEATFAVGTLNLTYLGAADTSSIHLEVNRESYTYVTSGFNYMENYGADMSQGDIVRMQTPLDHELGFAVYAPIGGEYSMTAVMSILGQTYTSDVNMSVNGTIYPLTAETMTKTADLTNTSDRGLMKRFRKNNTVFLKKGMNSIVFSGIEKRENYKDLYLYFLDCFDFTFVNETIEIETNAASAGVYKYSVLPAYSAEYAVEVTMVSQEPLHRLPDCSVSANATDYVKLIKGETVKVVSEYSDGGYLYGTYRLLNNVSLNNAFYLNINSNNCTIEKISLIPGINALDEICADTDKVVLVPGEKADISLFAADERGYALNLDYLRKNGALTFKSSDRDIIAVDSYGHATALKPGIAYVTVAALDGENVKTCEVEFNVYNEKYGFTVLSAKRDANYVKVRLLSPFGAKEAAHTMVIAEYADNILVRANLYLVGALNKGQIVTYKVPITGNMFKVISLNSLTNLKPACDAVTVKEVQ